ncbi:MAG: adenosylcobinamide-GDP ribazoletransferase [Proteobacteria bacterium]|nr:adenosylcobinamide-GDP ribazoletransferase [Pseudomonadota bacterium]
MALVALQFLTRVPVPSRADFEPGWLAASLRYFPLIGAGVGLANALVWALAATVFPAPVAVGLMMGASLLLTGGFHEDGLADACDGFGGGRSRERTLAIMQDSRIGAFGALGLVIVLGLKWSVLAGLPVGWIPMTLVVSHAVSRWAAIALIWALPYARTEGDGKSHPFAHALHFPGWLLAGLVAATVPLALAASGWGPLAQAAVVFAIAGAGSLLAAATLGAYFRHRIGGYTGDCLGATQQISELTLLLVVAALTGPHGIAPASLP